MLVEMAIADAFSIPWEFVTTEQHEALGPSTDIHYRQHPKYPTLGNGRYTDDTQRAIANALVMLQGDHHLPSEYVSHYLNIYKNDPREGYSKSFSQFLMTTKTSSDWKTNVKPYGKTNGALMGAAPLGFLETPFDVRMAAYVQAGVTHGPETFVYASAVALMAHFFIYDLGSVEELPEFLDEFQPFQDRDWSDLIDFPHFSVDMSAQQTCHAIFHNLMTQKTLMDLMHNAITLTGDTDSVAASSVAIASMSKEYVNDIPKALYDGLENSYYGTLYLSVMDRRLLGLKNSD